MYIVPTTETNYITNIATKKFIELAEEKLAFKGYFFFNRGGN